MMLMVMISTMEEGGDPDRSELEALLLRVADGDQDAFAQVYHRALKKLRAFVKGDDSL